MGKKRNRDKDVINQPQQMRFTPKALFHRTNRGILLDIVVFLVNLFLMRMLMERFVDLVNAAYGDDGIAQLALLLYFVSLLFLAPVGAVLKRWHFHQRLSQNGDDKALEPNGCLFSPILYYAVIVVIYALIDAILFQYFYPDSQPPPVLFIGTVAFGLVAMGIHTWLVYRYFSPPKNPPTSTFLLSPLSEAFGDVCIFVNMLFFQIIWNILSSGFVHPKSGYDVFANLLGMTFAALLIYFPPRMIYLAEDIGRRRTWFFILLANLPVIYHALFGSGHAINLIR